MSESDHLPWHGIKVSLEDWMALKADYLIFGTAFVESTSDGYGRRIAPKDMYVAKHDLDKTNE